MIDVLLACGHTVRRNPPGLKVPPSYRCWRCKSDEVVLRWYVLT